MLWRLPLAYPKQIKVINLYTIPLYTSDYKILMYKKFHICLISVDLVKPDRKVL